MTVLSVKIIVELLEKRILIASEPIGKTSFTKKLWYEPLDNTFIIFDGENEKVYHRDGWYMSEIVAIYNRI
jgi:hypothetical protein